MSITASLVDISCRYTVLISFVVYYRVYLSEGKGDEKAKTFFDESDISLGRINTLLIAPPLTAGSLKACIAKVEGLVTPGHALYKDMELFQDINSDTAMSDTDVISFQGDNLAYPGSDEGNPVAIVNATASSTADRKTPGKVLSQNSLGSATTNRALSDRPNSQFTKRARITWVTVTEIFRFPSYSILLQATKETNPPGSQ